MKLKSLNKDISKWGYSQDMEYTDADFHGHQRGVAVGIKNNVTGKIEVNCLPKSLGDEQTRDFMLEELLNDKSILLIENGITQFDEEGKNLVPKTIYYLPYYVDGHSVLQPTVTNENISGACNVSYECKVELLFVEDGLNRYATIDFNTRNISIMDMVHDLFEWDELEDELANSGVHFEEETDEDEEGFYLDFYNEAGERYNLCFSTLERLRDDIVSMRLIDIKCHIDCEEKKDETGRETESSEH